MRLIDADEIVYTHEIARSLDDGHNWNELCVTQDDIESLSTVDAVEVVRCVDCCHHEDEEPNMVYCPNIVGGWVQNDFFCKDGSIGER